MIIHLSICMCVRQQEKPQYVMYGLNVCLCTVIARYKQLSISLCMYK